MTDLLAAPPRPAPGAPRPFHFPAFTTRVLANGLRVLVAPMHGHPVVTVLAVVEAGAARDPAGRDGLAVLTARALAEGTATMDALALAERVESIGTVLDTGADWDSTIVQLTALTDRREDAFAVLAEVLRAPAFPEAELARLSAERLADLAQIRAEPRALADIAVHEAVYAESSRFARLAGGDEACVRAITRDDVVGFHATHCTPDATSLIIVGDCTLEDATRLVDAHFGDWAGVAPAAPAADVSRRYGGRRVHVIDKPAAQQAEIRLAHVAVPRAHPDYFPLVVMNAILGGVFNSRLNLNLRERHGFTYGAHSSFDWRRAASPFEVGAAVQTDKTADAVREALAEIERMRDEPVRDAELSLAVSYLDGVFPIRFETTAAVAGGLANVEIFRLPSRYFDDYRAHVRAVTAADVQRVARAHLDPSALQVIVVAPAAEVAAPLEALAIGPVSVRAPSAPTG